MEQVLVPVLTPGDIVVMDKLGSHKSCRVRDLIEAAGAKLRFLPPYGPGFSPARTPSRKSKRTSGEPQSAPSPASGIGSARSSTT